MAKIGHARLLSHSLLASARYALHKVGLMADLKFSCPQCSQHISCDEAWSGHQIACPTCGTSIGVPDLQSPVAAPSAAGPKLAAGVTQVPRSTAHASTAPRRPPPRPPRSDSSLLRYGILLMVVVALAGVGYFWGLPLVTNALQQESTAKNAADAKSSQSGGAVGGPMGDVNSAMDVSDALDSGSSRKSRPAPGTKMSARSFPAGSRR